MVLLELKEEAEIAKVTDMVVIVGFGVIALPALAINGKLVWQGKIGPVEELSRLIQKYADHRD